MIENGAYLIIPPTHFALSTCLSQTNQDPASFDQSGSEILTRLDERLNPDESRMPLSQEREKEEKVRFIKTSAVNCGNQDC